MTDQPPAGPPAGPPPGPPPGPPAGPPPEALPGSPYVEPNVPPWKKRGIGSVLVGVALIAAAVGGGFVMLRDDGKDGGARGSDVAQESAGEIFLEPVAYRTPESFTQSVDAHNSASASTTVPVLSTLPPPEENSSTSTTAVAVRTVQGSSPGLYGGTRDNAACDSEKLITFLQDNPDKAAAWAGVLGVTTAAIPDYVRSLTPVVLQRDTRVTNHGFRNGRATTLHSVLQAGTAVLVDDRGVPRVKCGCGNPLTEPTAVSGPATYTGQTWPAFTPANVIVVAPAPAPMITIILVDVSGGDPFDRPIGTVGTDDTLVTADSLCDLYPEDEQCGAPTDVATGAEGEPVLGTGDVQITLRWSSTADLDLSVTDPTGAYINFDNPASSSGGQLDVDSNGGCETMTPTPVENIYWPEGTAPDGDYLITVEYYDVCPGGEGQQAFTLTFLLGGTPVSVIPASFEGEVGVQLLVYRGEVSVVTATAAAIGETAFAGVLDPGGTQSFTSTKTPGFVATSSTTVAPAAPPDEGPGGAQTDCSVYEEGTPMRILCEHDPTTNDISGGPVAPPVAPPETKPPGLDCSQPATIANMQDWLKWCQIGG